MEELISLKLESRRNRAAVSAYNLPSACLLHHICVLTWLEQCRQEDGRI